MKTRKFICLNKNCKKEFEKQAEELPVKKNHQEEAKSKGLGIQRATCPYCGSTNILENK